MKKVLDPCCGSRMFYFDPDNKHVLYTDIRRDKRIVHGKRINVDPDLIVDFRDMPYEDESFYHVVFDPPHLKWAGNGSIFQAQYGKLNRDRWQEDIAQGFSECWRVLKQYGTLVFKWSEKDIKVSEILVILPQKPLYGHRRGNNIWLVFIKGISREEENDVHASRTVDDGESNNP